MGSAPGIVPEPASWGPSEGPGSVSPGSIEASHLQSTPCVEQGRQNRCEGGRTLWIWLVARRGSLARMQQKRVSLSEGWARMNVSCLYTGVRLGQSVPCKVGIWLARSGGLAASFSLVFSSYPPRVRTIIVSLKTKEPLTRGRELPRRDQSHTDAGRSTPRGRQDMLDRDFVVHASTGTAGAVVGVYAGAPLDTVKVLLQSRHDQYKGKSGRPQPCSPLFLPPPFRDDRPFPRVTLSAHRSSPLRLNHLYIAPRAKRSLLWVPTLGSSVAPAVLKPT